MTKMKLIENLEAELLQTIKDKNRAQLHGRREEGRALGRKEIELQRKINVEQAYLDSLQYRKVCA